MQENYFITKLTFIVNKSFDLKTLHNGFDVLDKNTAIKLVSENFDCRNDIERRLVNTFKYHVNNIVKPIFENKILLGQFINGICISNINALMSGDYYSRYFFNKVIDLIFDKLDIESKKKLTISDFNKSIVLLERYFVTRPTTGLASVESLTMEPEVLDLHKRVYVNALKLTFDKSFEVNKFHLNLLLSIVKCYEVELRNKNQQKELEPESTNRAFFNCDYESDNYSKWDNDEYDNATNSPFYDDNLDMDQQSPEFWNSL